MKVKDYLKAYSDMEYGHITKNEKTRRIETSKKGRRLTKHEMRYAIVHTFAEEFNHLVRIRQHTSKEFILALKQVEQMYSLFYRRWKKLYSSKEKSNTALDGFMDDKRKEKGEEFLVEDFKVFMLDAFQKNKELFPLVQDAFKNE